MTHSSKIAPSRALRSVRYEIRGRLARRAMELERQHVLAAPGSSFNTGYRDHFRITTLADEDTIEEVFWRIGNVLREMACGH